MVMVVVASVSDHGLKGKVALRKHLMGKQCYMNTDSFGPLLLQMHVFLDIKDQVSAPGADYFSFLGG